jgi:5-formyltetrahydrofolate cyclo-ligase
MKNKDDIREFISGKRKMLRFEWVMQQSEIAAKKMIALPEFRKAKTVCCYVALPGEVMTQEIIEKCWDGNKKVCVPAFREETKRYELAGFERNARLAEGLYGVPEPAEAGWTACEKVDFIVVPGLAFDASGGRVGHGGGHYDKILQRLRKQAFRAGLAFDFQVLGRVPMETWDVGVDAVITEKRVIRSAGGALSGKGDRQ